MVREKHAVVMAFEQKNKQGSWPWDFWEKSILCRGAKVQRPEAEVCSAGIISKGQCGRKETKSWRMVEDIVKTCIYSGQFRKKALGDSEQSRNMFWLEF